MLVLFPFIVLFCNLIQLFCCLILWLISPYCRTVAVRWAVVVIMWGCVLICPILDCSYDICPVLAESAWLCVRYEKSVLFWLLGLSFSTLCSFPSSFLSVCLCLSWQPSIVILITCFIAQFCVFIQPQCRETVLLELSWICFDLCSTQSVTFVFLFFLGCFLSLFVLSLLLSTVCFVCCIHNTVLLVFAWICVVRSVCAFKVRK